MGKMACGKPVRLVRSNRGLGAELAVAQVRDLRACGAIAQGFIKVKSCVRQERLGDRRETYPALVSVIARCR